MSRRPEDIMQDAASFIEDRASTDSDYALVREIRAAMPVVTQGGSSAIGVAWGTPPSASGAETWSETPLAGYDETVTDISEFITDQNLAMVKAWVADKLAELRTPANGVIRHRTFLIAALQELSERRKLKSVVVQIFHPVRKTWVLVSRFNGRTITESHTQYQGIPIIENAH